MYITLECHTDNIAAVKKIRIFKFSVHENCFLQIGDFIKVISNK